MKNIFKIKNLAMITGITLLGSLSSNAQNSFPATGNVSIGSELGVIGTTRMSIATVANTLTVTGTAKLNGTADVASTLSVYGDTYLKGRFDLTKDLKVNGIANFKSNVFAEAALTVNGVTTLKANTYVNGSFHVDSQSFFKNGINVFGNIIGVGGDITCNGNIYTHNGSFGGKKCLIGFEGIDKTTTNAQMQFDNTITNRKIDLYNYNGESETAFYGFGISPYTLRYQVDSPLASHVFFASNGDNPNELMRIKGDGNVGIGTSNPNSKLAVNGAVTALDYALVSSMAADYVFEPDYKLKTLSETEAYIKANKHLPAFKSAKHYEANGYTMTEMNIALEQTVEEITLHSIAQEKEINHLKEEINLQNIAQEKETNILKNELAEIKAMLLAKK